MDVSQVMNLAAWSTDSLPQIAIGYENLYQVLDFNSKQHQKKPLREEFQKLNSVLEGVV